MIRVLLVTPSRRAETGLRELLRSSSTLQIVGVLEDMSLLSASLEDTHPDVVVAEIPANDGALPDEILDVSEETPVPIVLLLDQSVAENVLEALRGGVRAILPRNANANVVSAAIEAVANGLAVLTPESLATLARDTHASQHAASPTLVEELTRREIEVLGMMAEGLGNKEISGRLHISEHTVKFHVASIMGKLNATSRTEAVTTGIRHGLVML